MPWKTLWWVAAALTGTLTLSLAAIRLAPSAANLAAWPLPLLLAAIGVSPLAVAAAARARHRWGRVLLVGAGAVLASAGLAGAARDDFLSLALVTHDWRMLARGASATAPVGLMLLGLAWVGAAAGAARRRRAWLRVASGVIGLTGLWFAASVAASSIWRVRQGMPLQADIAGLATGALLGLAGLLALGVPWVVGALGREPAESRAADDGVPVTWSDPSPPRRARPIAAGLVAVLLLGGAVALWADRSARIVLAEEFDDPGLATCVAAAVGVDGPDARVSAADLGDVLALDCSISAPGGGAATPISDLTGLGALTNLSTLDLTGNAVADLGPVADLDLWGLVVNDNPVADLSPLSGMTMLTNLGASGTQVRDAGPLAGLDSLAYLGMRGTGITDIGPLGAVPNLRELDLSENAISDVGPLAGLQLLTTLQIPGNAVTDLGELGPLPALWSLDAARNRISDLSTFPEFPVLDEVWLGENPLTDVDPLTSLPALTGVDLAGLPSDLPGIAELRAAGVYVGGLA